MPSGNRAASGCVQSTVLGLCGLGLQPGLCLYLMHDDDHGWRMRGDHTLLLPTEITEMLSMPSSGTSRTSALPSVLTRSAII